MNHDTVRGRISTAWGWSGPGAWWYELELPEGVWAWVELPGQGRRELPPGRHQLRGFSSS
jgi:hypothetical protein